jgi:hypothetical protein
MFFRTVIWPLAAVSPVAQTCRLRGSEADD